MLGTTLGFFLLFATAQAAEAAENITIVADRSQVLRLARPPGTLVVGNPSIADVTIEGSQLFFHARSYGRTNVIVLDDKGEPLTEYLIRVVADDPDSAVIYKGGEFQTARQTYSCAPLCEPTVTPGDSAAFLSATLSGAQAKIGFARGQPSGEAQRSAAPDAILPDIDLMPTP